MSNDFWRTPPYVFDYWNELWHFDIDAAANEWDRKCDIWIDEEMDALTLDWCELMPDGPGVAWCNPPYSRVAGPLDRWVKKFIEEAEHGWTVCALLTADTSTEWWNLVWDRDGSCWRLYDDVHIVGYFLSPRVRHTLPPQDEPGYDPKKKEGSPTWGSVIIIFSGG